MSVSQSVMAWWSVEGQDTGSGVSKNGDHSRRTAAIRLNLFSSRQFSAHTKSSRARIDKRTARAARNTRYRYNQIGPLDHTMADDCVSLARTNTVSSTIKLNHEKHQIKATRLQAFKPYKQNVHT